MDQFTCIRILFYSQGFESELEQASTDPNPVLQVSLYNKNYMIWTLCTQIQSRLGQYEY